MGTPISFNSGTTASYTAGIFKKATVGLNLQTGLVSGNNWWNGVDVSSSQYLIYSDIYSQGQSTFAGSRPTAWSTPDLSDASLILLINTLPDRVGQPGFTTVSQAVNWLNQTGKYFLIKTGYENIVTSNLQLSLDAGWYNSYPGSGGSWYDLSPNTITTTLVNGISLNGNDNGALVLDGTDDYIIIPDVSPLDIPTAITVEAWVYYNAVGGTSSYSVITCKGYPWNWLLEDQGGIFNFRISTSNVGDSNLSSNYEHGLKTWNHVVATYDGSTQKIYVNGVLKNSQSLTGTIETVSSNMYIGCYTPTSYNLTGKLAILRIYSTALSASQILQNFYAQAYRFGVNNNVVTSGLIVNLDSRNSLSYAGSGTNWVDLSGEQNNFTLGGPPTYSSSVGFTFVNGSISYYAIKDPFSFPTTFLTIEIWYKTNVAGTGIVSYASSAEDNNYLLFSPENVGIYGPNGAVSSGVNTADNNWTQVVRVSNRTTGLEILYVNGVNVFSTTLSEGINFTTGGSLVIAQEQDCTGGCFDGGQAFGGNILLFRLYNRTLSAAEVRQNYLQGNMVTSNLLLAVDGANLCSYGGSGTTWKDLSGNNNNGTLQNGVGYSNTYGGVLTFDGTNDQVATSINRATLGNNMSVEAFFRYTGNEGDAYRPIIGGNETGAGGTEFFLGKNSGNNYFGVQDGNYDGGFVTNYNVFDGNWHHMCYTYDNTEGKLYLDGILRNTGYFSKCNDSEQIYIAAEVQEGYWWKGDIGKVAYYTKTLNALEVTQNFNAYKSRYGL